MGATTATDKSRIFANGVAVTIIVTSTNMPKSWHRIFWGTLSVIEGPLASIVFCKAWKSSLGHRAQTGACASRET